MYYMSTNQKYTTLTAALQACINGSDLSFKELERQTGVLRQSLMKFARGEQSLRLDLADRLAVFFELEVTRTQEK